MGSSFDFYDISSAMLIQIVVVVRGTRGIIYCDRLVCDGLIAKGLSAIGVSWNSVKHRWTIHS
jgi:hypothetical protein